MECLFLLTRNLGIIKVFSRRFSNPPSSTSQAVSSPVSIAILQEAINFAREQGAKQLITTSPLGVERLLRAAGFRAHRAGPPMTIDGYSMFACLIDI